MAMGYSGQHRHIGILHDHAIIVPGRENGILRGTFPAGRTQTASDTQLIQSVARQRQQSAATRDSYPKYPASAFNSTHVRLFCECIQLEIVGLACTNEFNRGRCTDSCYTRRGQGDMYKRRGPLHHQ